MAEPRFTGPLVEGILVCAIWSLVTLGTGYAIFRRRDITGG